MTEDFNFLIRIAQLAGVFVGFGALIVNIFEAAFMFTQFVYSQQSRAGS